MQSRALRYGMGTLGMVAAASLALTGCSSGSDSEDKPSAENPITLNYTIWDQNQEPALREAADAFEAENENVTVDITVVPSADYWTKIQTQLKAGSDLDVFWMNGPNFQLYASNDQLLALDDAGVNGSDYPKSLVDMYTFDGVLYGAPKDFDTIGVYYNKALFDKAGLDYPKAGWTWDDFVTAANKISDPTSGVYGTAAAPYGQMTYYNTIYQAGGEVISADGETSGYDTPEAAEGVQIWADLIDSGASPTLQQITDTWPGDTFTSGKMGMFWDGSWAAGTYSQAEAIKDVVGVAPLPVGPAGDDVSVVHGLANVVSAKSKHPELAKELAAFLGGKVTAEIQAKTATVIPAFNGTQQEWLAALPTIDAQIFLDAADTGVPLPISQNTTAWVTAEEAMIKDIYTGKVTTADGLKGLAKKMNELLAAE